MTGKQRWLSFIGGMLTGITLLTIFLLGLVYLGSNKTWLLRVNTNGISGKVEGAAQIMATEMLPEYIEIIKATVPEMVAARVSNQFDDVKFQLGGREYALPEEFIQSLEDNYRTTLISSITELLGSMPMDKMCAALGQEIADIVENSLYAEYNTRVIEVEILPEVISIPLMIELVNQPGEGNFQLEFYSAKAIVEH